MKNRILKRVTVSAALLSALLLGCVACTSGDADTQTLTEPETTASAPDTAPETEPDDAPDVFPEGDNIEIGIFYEPPHDFTTPEQYDWIRDANITFIEVTNSSGAINKEVSNEQIRLAKERGIKITYNAGVDGKNLLAMTEDEITGYVKELAKDPTITSMHVKDEPAQPWTYAKVCAAVKRGGLMPRLNFLPYFATWIFDDYKGFIEDTIVAAGKEDYGYLSYDHYPYPYDGGDPDTMFHNLEIIRQIGLKYDVPTACYIQSIGEHNNFRRTNGNEIRYQMSTCLAYGVKSMTYFTWWTTGFCDPADYAIISPYGDKTDIYDDVAQINADILRVGTLLRRLDAVKVYHTKGTEQSVTRCTSDDVPFYGKNALIISLMEDRETGRDYVMLVNKHYKKGVTCEFTVSDRITQLFDCTEGSYDPVDISTGSFTATFKPGGFRIYAVGKKDNIVDREYDAGENIAQDKAVAAAAVYPGAGFYTYCVNDGVRGGSSGESYGYRSEADTGYLEVDLGRVTAFDRVDIYPTGTNYTRGQTFPRDFRIEVSSDGKTYETLVERKEYDDALHAIPSFTFDRTEGRYVRLTVLRGCEQGGFEIGEIEIYNGGSVPAPDNGAFYTDPTAVEKGTNVALGKAVRVRTELGGAWRKENLTDGDRETNYSSALNQHETEDGEEWILIDLAAPLEFNEVDVYPRGDGQNFPYKFRIEISDDGKDFTSIYECDVPKIPVNRKPSVCTLDKTYRARYVRVFAYKLRDQEGFNDGHIFQASEVEIYNK